MTGLARNDHPDTSKEAAEKIGPHQHTQWLEILAFLDNTQGFTDQEMQDRLSMSESSQRPRRKELERMGRVRASGDKRKTRSGRDAQVWVITESGREYLNDNGK